MLDVWVIVAAACAVALIEMPSLRKGRRVREMALFVALLLLGAGLGIAECVVEVPTPLEALKTFYRPMVDWLTAFGLIAK